MKIKGINKEKIIQELHDFLLKEKKIIFAYLHGSFLGENEFNDVDIAIYVDENTLDKNPVDFEISLSLKLD